MKLFVYAILAVTGAFLGACGGGSDAQPSMTLSSTVSSVSFDRLMYGKPTVFTVTGGNLERGISLSAPNCDVVSQVAGGTDKQQVFTCTPMTTGTLTVSVKHADGTLLATINPLIPPPQVMLKTTLGDILLELNPTAAPVTVNNFLQYVSSNFYQNLIFHRVEPEFVIQGGGFNAALQLAPTQPPIKLEMPNGLSNIRGTIAMARTQVLDSATSQFFINTVDNARLDGSAGYAVFGRVVAGLATVDQIAAVPTQTVSGLPKVPVTAVVINSAVQTQ